MGTKQEQRITYVFYKDWSEIIETMPAEMELQVRRAIDAYAFNDEVMDLPLAAKYFFEAIKKDIDRDKEKFETKKAKRAEAGRKHFGNQYTRKKQNPDPAKNEHLEQTEQMEQVSQNGTNGTENENGYENENGLQGLNPMCNKRNNTLSKESALKEKPQGGIALAPTLEQIKDYILAKNFNVDAEQFFSVYQANGWVQKGGQPIKDWKAQVRVWERNGLGNQAAKTKKESSAQKSEATAYSSRSYNETRERLAKQEKAAEGAITYEEFKKIQQQNGNKQSSNKNN